MEEIVFLVQGSEQEPYKVTFKRQGTALTADCTCQAAINGLHCKHRLNLLTGETAQIVSDNKREVEVVLSWLKGTDLESLIAKVSETEKVFEKTKKELANLKKKLSKALRGGT
jgi:uncharacterized Zn finger protein